MLVFDPGCTKASIVIIKSVIMNTDFAAPRMCLNIYISLTIPIVPKTTVSAINTPVSWPSKSRFALYEPIKIFRMSNKQISIKVS